MTNKSINKGNRVINLILPFWDESRMAGRKINCNSGNIYLRYLPQPQDRTQNFILPTFGIAIFKLFSRHTANIRNMDPLYEVFSAPADEMPARAASNSESLSSSKMTTNVRDEPKTLRAPTPALEVGKLGKAKTGKEGAACSKVPKSSSKDIDACSETSGSDSGSSSGYETEGTSIFSVNQHEGEGTYTVASNCHCVAEFLR